MGEMMSTFSQVNWEFLFIGVVALLIGIIWIGIAPSFILNPINETSVLILEWFR